jgi:hypothetical protein
VEGAQARCLFGVRPQRVGKKDVVDPAGGHDLGLAKCPNGYAVRARLDLCPRERHALVRLRVRPQRDPASSQGIRHATSVALDDVQVDDQRRRVQPCGQDRRDGSNGGLGDSHGASLQRDGGLGPFRIPHKIAGGGQLALASVVGHPRSHLSIYAARVMHVRNIQVGKRPRARSMRT